MLSASWRRAYSQPFAFASSVIAIGKVGEPTVAPVDTSPIAHEVAQREQVALRCIAHRLLLDLVLGRTSPRGPARFLPARISRSSALSRMKYIPPASRPSTLINFFIATHSHLP